MFRPIVAIVLLAASQSFAQAPPIQSVTINAAAGDSVIATFPPNGNLSIPAPAKPIYLRAKTQGEADAVEFRFADGVVYVEKTAPFTYGLQFNPRGWNPKPGRYDISITARRNGKAGPPKVVTFVVLPVPTSKPTDPVPVDPVKPVETPFGGINNDWYFPTNEGFNAFPLAPGAREFFVSTGRGNDSAAGTAAAPLRTIQRAAALCRDKSGDRVRVFAGETYYGQTDWTKSGPAGFFTGIIAYDPNGTGRRPVIETSTNGIRVTKSVQNVAVSGLLITCTIRNPNRPATFNRNPPETAGIDLRNAGCRNVLIEDCKVEWFGNNIVCHPNVTGKHHDGVTVNRNIIVDAWGPRIYAGQGLYCDETLNLVVSENLYDHNGWIESVIRPTIFRHDNYINEHSVGALVVRNWIFRAASFGAQIRGGGKAEGNLFFDNGNAVLTAGARGTVQRNVFLGGHAVAFGDNLPAQSGASGVNASSSYTEVSGNYFWGRPAADMPGMKSPNAAIEVTRTARWTPVGPMTFMVTGNGFVSWAPASRGTPNLLTVAGADKAPDWSKNFRAKVARSVRGVAEQRTH
jgi:hypothetical protein